MFGHGSAEYQSANRLARSAFRSDKKQYVSQRVREQGRASVWKNIKDTVGSKRPNVQTLPSASADDLNNFFVSVGPRVAAELDSCGPAPSLPTRLPRVGACAFSLQPVGLQSLHKIIFGMRNSPARGDHGICIRMLKLGFSAIGHVLFHISNLCLTTNDIPDQWKHSRVLPVYKFGDPSDPSNFRPISILPVISKIVERVVQRQLYYYLSVNHLLSPTHIVFVRCIPRRRHSPTLPTKYFWHLTPAKSHSFVSSI